MDLERKIKFLMWSCYGIIFTNLLLHIINVLLCRYFLDEFADKCMYPIILTIIITLCSLGVIRYLSIRSKDRSKYKERLYWLIISIITLNFIFSTGNMFICDKEDITIFCFSPYIESFILAIIGVCLIT